MTVSVLCLFLVAPVIISQSVVSQTTDPGFVSLISTRSYIFVEIDHEIIYTVILLLPLFKKGCVQLQIKVYA